MRGRDWLALGGAASVSLTTVRCAGWCGCGAHIAVGDVAGIDHVRRRLLCLDCFLPGRHGYPRRHGGRAAGPNEPGAAAGANQPGAAAGRPGASAWREYQRLRAQRREELRERLPHLGDLLAALTPEPPSTRAWASGARGEQRVGHALTDLAADWVYALHDRRIPGRRTNIDHIAVAPSGVFVIDAKNFTNASVEVRLPSRRSPLVEQLLVAGRDRTEFVGAMQRQVLTVHDALADLDLGLEPGDAPAQQGPVIVQPMLCFAGGNLPLLGRLSVDNVPVVGLREMQRIVRRPGPLDVHTRYRIYTHLAGRLPSMT